MKSITRNLFVCYLIIMALGCFLSPAKSLAYEIQIDVAPNVLNIESGSEIVTVHTDVAYSAVVGSSVYLNDVPISHWKSDARGNFVAKFLSEEIKMLDGLIIGDYNTLILNGYTTDGDAFIGSQDIKVIEVFSKGQE